MKFYWIAWFISSSLTLIGIWSLLSLQNLIETLVYEEGEKDLEKGINKKSIFIKPFYITGFLYTKNIIVKILFSLISILNLLLCYLLGEGLKSIPTKISIISTLFNFGLYISIKIDIKKFSSGTSQWSPIFVYSSAVDNCGRVTLPQFMD